MKLKPYKFQDGTEVTSKSFVDAWNYAAYGPNAQFSGYFMAPIEGFADLQCAGTANPDDPCEGYTPKAKEMTGLKIVDDKTFTIKTTEKVSNLPVRLGYSAFAPLPESFFKDPKAFGDKPIGAGPYKLDSWTKEQAIVLSKFADYSGDFGGKVDKVTFKIYQDPDAAYNDVIANNLDVTDEIPASALIDDKYKSDLPDRNAQKESGVIQTITAAPSQGRPELRRPEDQAGDLDGDRPRHHHQADLQRHQGPRHRLGLPGRRRLQGRRSAASSASTTRPRPRRCSQRPAASRVTRSPSPTTPTPLTRSGPRPPATASSRRSVSSARPSGSSTSRPSAARSPTAR